MAKEILTDLWLSIEEYSNLEDKENNYTPKSGVMDDDEFRRQNYNASIRLNIATEGYVERAGGINAIEGSDLENPDVPLPEDVQIVLKLAAKVLIDWQVFTKYDPLSQMKREVNIDAGGGTAFFGPDDSKVTFEQFPIFVQDLLISSGIYELIENPNFAPQIDPSIFALQVQLIASCIVDDSYLPTQWVKDALEYLDQQIAAAIIGSGIDTSKIILVKPGQTLDGELEIENEIYNPNAPICTPGDPTYDPTNIICSPFRTKTVTDVQNDEYVPEFKALRRAIEIINEIIDSSLLIDEQNLLADVPLVLPSPTIIAKTQLTAEDNLETDDFILASIESLQYKSSTAGQQIALTIYKNVIDYVPGTPYSDVTPNLLHTTTVTVAASGVIQSHDGSVELKIGNGLGPLDEMFFCAGPIIKSGVNIGNYGGSADIVGSELTWLYVRAILRADLTALYAAFNPAGKDADGPGHYGFEAGNLVLFDNFGGKITITGGEMALNRKITLMSPGVLPGDGATVGQLTDATNIRIKNLFSTAFQNANTETAILNESWRNFDLIHFLHWDVPDNDESASTTMMTIDMGIHLENNNTNGLVGNSNFWVFNANASDTSFTRTGGDQWITRISGVAFPATINVRIERLLFNWSRSEDLLPKYIKAGKTLSHLVQDQLKEFFGIETELKLINKILKDMQSKEDNKCIEK